MRILLANPRGFCAGVDRAIDIVERALNLFGAPIYVRHEVVHNRYVVDRLREAGAIFVDELDDIPDGATVVFSAHGVPKSVQDEAAARNVTVFDATCPLVTKVHMEVKRYADEGREVVLIGHEGHPEVEGTLGQFDTNGGGSIQLVQNVKEAERIEIREPGKVAFVTQTTLSVDDTAEDQIGSALAAEVELYCVPGLKEKLDRLDDELRFVLITSDARVHDIGKAPGDAVAASDVGGNSLSILVSPSEHAKCARCWHRREDVGANPDHPEICARCVENVSGDGERRHFA